MILATEKSWFSRFLKIEKFMWNTPQNASTDPKIIKASRVNTMHAHSLVFEYGAKHSPPRRGAIFPFGGFCENSSKWCVFMILFQVFMMITTHHEKKSFKIKMVGHIDIHIFQVPLSLASISFVFRIDPENRSTFEIFMKTTRGHQKASGWSQMNSKWF